MSEGPGPSGRPLRLLLAVNDLSIGGAERTAVDYAIALAARGHDVAVFAGPGPLARDLERAGIERAGRSAQLRRPWAIPAAALAIARTARRRRIDLVHAFMASSAVAASGARLLRRVSGDAFAVVASVPGLQQHPGEAPWLSHLRLRLLAAGPDLVLAPSPALAALLGSLGVPRAKIREVEFNAIPVERFRRASPDPALRASLDLAPEDRVICSVARLHPVKGLDTVLRAAPEVLRRVPAAKFLFVGEGPQRGELERLAAELGVSGSVRFPGERSDVPEILALASVVLQTTHGLGGPGISSLESFAAGRPVVGFETSERREAIAGADIAVYVPEGNVGALAGALADLLAAPDRLARMGRAAAEFVTRYDVALAAERLEAIYREAMALAARSR